MIRHRTSVPLGVAHCEWRNTAGRRLRLDLPGEADTVEIAPGCRMQIRLADPRRSPRLDAWIEGCKLAGLLVRTRG